jgi:putative ATP-binding cassette transporter
VIILDFIKRASRRDLALMLVLTVLAGFANALLVVMVNEVAGRVARGLRPGPSLWIGFILAFVVYYQCNKIALLRANTVIERLLKDLRIQITDKLRRSELQLVDKLGRGHLYALVSQETNHLSVTFPLLVDSFQQAVLLMVSLIYLAHLSTPAFVAFLVAVAFGVVGYRQINVQFRATLKGAFARQGDLLDALGDIIHGFKELRLNTRRSDAVHAAYVQVSQTAEDTLVASGEHWASLILLSSTVTYFLLGAVVFILPQYTDERGIVIFQLIPTLLFCMGPLAKIVANSPIFAQAEAGLRAILDVERQLDAGGGATPAEARDRAARYREFQRITYRGMTFTHRDESGAPVFVAGPWDMHLARGETVFLVGGNGSGKSTALRLMTGLYRADEGQIAVDGRPADGAAIAGFRELFSAIFADFHLFDRLYGLAHVDPGEVERLIAAMELSHKVRFEDGRFSETNLSTGQRKRLALIAALLEDRPIYVFDEWTAEQDVHFREYFYTVILAGLKAKGKTVVAVTHDERYWKAADRVIKLDLGAVLWEHTGQELDVS